MRSFKTILHQIGYGPKRAPSLIGEGVSNAPIKFESARKIWPLLELLAKIR